MSQATRRCPTKFEILEAWSEACVHQSRWIATGVHEAAPWLDELLGATCAEDLAWLLDEPDMMDVVLPALSMACMRCDWMIGRLQGNFHVDDQLTVVLTLLFARSSLRGEMIRLIMEQYPDGQGLSDLQSVKLADCVAFIGDALCLERLIARVEASETLWDAFDLAQRASHEACMGLLWPRCGHEVRLYMDTKERASMDALCERERAKREREHLSANCLVVKSMMTRNRF
ncbi:hypothetical protein [Xanthomonas citri]|uniref:hypothetical protein n=1 Tax=Xanthomonas citri TaxID=346 RepID=UPI00036110BD|nr:hypothetical protein [Xanthomonas citri]ARV22556.1 hypothetical protein A9D66_08075 [Xanthomonas citri pv. glycines str. 12-2]